MTFLNLIKETYAILEAEEPPQDAAMPSGDAGQEPTQGVDPEEIKKQIETQQKALGSVLKRTFLILDKASADIDNEMIKSFIMKMKDASDTVDINLIKSLDDMNSILESESPKFGIETPTLTP